jgi:hypothetical protein
MTTTYAKSGAEPLSQNLGKEAAISFRLPPPYGDKLIQRAAITNVSLHQAARTLVIACLEDPKPADLVTSLYELVADSEFGLTELRAVRRDIASFKVALAASLELFLTTAAEIDPQDAAQLVDGLLHLEEG